MSIISTCCGGSRLTDTWATARLKRAHQSLKRLLAQQGLRLPKNKRGRGAAQGDRLVRSLDCAVINLLNDTEDRRKGSLYDQAVRGVFEELRTRDPKFSRQLDADRFEAWLGLARIAVDRSDPEVAQARRGFAASCPHGSLVRCESEGGRT